MWFNWVWLTTTNSNVELESWLEHKAYVTSPFPLVRRAQTEIENMCHVKQMACSYWIPSLILDADWVFRTLIVEKPYQTQCITPSRYFICLMFGRGGTFVPYVLIFRLCRSVMKVTKTLWKPNASKEWYAVERQRTAAPLSERMPTMCGCAQAFGAGMCWKVGSVAAPATAFPGVTGKGKQQNHGTEMDRRRGAVGEKHPAVWSESPFLDMRSPIGAARTCKTEGRKKGEIYGPSSSLTQEPRICVFCK